MKKILHELVILLAIVLAMYFIGSSGPLSQNKPEEFKEQASIAQEKNNKKDNQSQEEFELSENLDNAGSLRDAGIKFRRYNLYKDYGFIEPVTVKLDEERKIDINNCSAKDFQEFKGVGEVLAKRIVEYRMQNGIFYSPEELINVKGIGEKKLDSILGK